MSRFAQKAVQSSFAKSSFAVCLMIVLGADTGYRLFPAMAAKPSLAQANACAFPTEPLATAEETAWRLFVAANCPSNSGKVVWENWIEQNDLYASPAIGKSALGSAQRHRLHGSLLAEMFQAQAHGTKLLLSPSTDCGSMGAAPPNVVATTICEETHINPQAASFITSHAYQTRAGQIAAADRRTDIQFTKPSVEVKVDWIPATDFSPAFSCASPPSGIHVEVVDGVCYAMVGMHIASKLVDNWIWATFEPQSMLTNPRRCITFGNCYDAWGSVPATSSGGVAGFTNATPALRQLMAQAKLAPEFANYRLDGTQTVFNKPEFLGNSIIEGENVGMTKNTASCISCHSESTVSTSGEYGSAKPLWGRKFNPPPGSIARDFVWSLSLAR